MVFDRRFLTQAVYPWIRKIEASQQLNSALPFQLVTVFKFVEAEDSMQVGSDVDMISEYEETKEIDEWQIETL
jgi:hypothetical protein